MNILKKMHTKALLRKYVVCWLLGLSCTLLAPDLWAQTVYWRTLAKGLELGELTPAKELYGQAHPITVLRIDPAYYAFRLLSASQHDGRRRTARQWCEEFELLAATNASMYMREKPLRSTGYMRNYKHFNNRRINPAFGAFMLFNPLDSASPPVRLVDRHLEPGWRKLLGRYATVVQNYRMISKGRKRGWPRQEKTYSTAAVGLDRDNQVLFIFSPLPYSTYSLIRALISLPIAISDAMYVEGGPAATLHINLPEENMQSKPGEKKREWLYSYQNTSPPLPNVIGIEKRK